MITSGYTYAENIHISAKVKFYDMELGGTADDGRLLFELTGMIVGGSFTFSNNSDMLASGNLSIVVDEIWQPKLSPAYFKQWYKCKCKVFKIYNYENGNKTEIPYGVYIVGNNSWNYNISSHILTMTLKDCMEALTENYGNTIIGRSGGHDAPTWAFVQYESILIEAGRSIGDTVIEFNENYAPFAYEVSIDGITGENTFPYDLQIDSSSGLYEALVKMKEIVAGGRMFFDLNGMLHFGQIPMRWEEPCHVLSSQFKNLVISEQWDVNPDSYRNAVIVWGAEITDTATATTSGDVPVPTDPSEVGRYFGVAADYSDAIFEDTKCEVLNFDNLCGNYNCRAMAEYELYKRKRLQRTLTVTLVDRPMPMMYQIKGAVLNVGQKIEYTSISTGETDLYILEEFKNDLAACTITLTLSKFYSFYPPDDDTERKDFGTISYTYTLYKNILRIVFSGDASETSFKIFVDYEFAKQTETNSIELMLEDGQHYIQILAYNPEIEQKEIGSFSIAVGDVGEEWLTTEKGEPLSTQQGYNIIIE